MKATYILDTSKMLTRELRLELEKIFVEERRLKIFTLQLCLLDLNMSAAGCGSCV